MSERTARTTHIEEHKVTQENVSGPLPSAPLVTFDLNLNNLQDYLNKVSALVNRNTVHIQKISEEVSSKLSYPDGFELLEGIALSIPRELGGQRPKSKNYKDGLNAAHDGIQGLCDKIKDIDDFKKDTVKRLERFENTLSLKISTDKFDSEKRGLEEKIDEKIGKDIFNNKISNVNSQIKLLEDSFLNKLSDLDKKVSEMEVNTLWKLRDCENLLKTRVNEKFVWDALAASEQKLRKDLESLNSSKLHSFSTRFDLLEKELKRVEDASSLKIIESRRLLSELDSL